MIPAWGLRTVFSWRTLRIVIAALLVVVLVPLRSAAATTQTIDADYRIGEPATLRVGVVDSETTWINFWQHGWYKGRPPGAIEHLRAQGYNVVELRDGDLLDRGTLDSLDVLLLPVNRVLTEESEQVLMQWLYEGGHLVVSMIGARVLPNAGCHWSGSQHPRYMSDWRDYWNCGEGPDDGFTQWFERLNSNVFEWGPLSEAYGMRLVNDPTSREFHVVDAGLAHPLIAATMTALDLNSIQLDRNPPGAGAEYPEIFSSRVTPMLQYSIPTGTGSFEGFSMDQFDGFPAAQTGTYGSGRFVYFNFDILDFLPEVIRVAAIQPHVSASISQGEVASDILQRSLWWASRDSGTVAAIDNAARTYGEVDAWYTSIYVRQYIEAVGDDSSHAVAHIEITDPAGAVVFDEAAEAYGLYPGQGPLRINWGYDKGSLMSGEYKVKLYVTWPYPDYDNMDVAGLTVVRNQGRNLPTVPIETGPLPQRLWGADRFETAAAISADTFEPGVARVYLATGYDFPDALAAVPAAIQANAPILLTRPDSMPPATRNELVRLRPQEIVVLGGEMSVGNEVVRQAHNFAAAVRRVAGTNRFATAAAIAEDSFTRPEVVFLSTGLNYPDALGAGPIAGGAGGPILLTLPDTIPADTLRAIQTLNPTKVVLVGGDVAISDEVRDALRADGREVSRVSGADRFSTGTALSQERFAQGVPVVYIATASSFPDALAGGVAAGRGGGPILLVNERGVPAATAAELRRLRPGRIVILGGTFAVPESVRAELAGFTG